MKKIIVIQAFILLSIGALQAQVTREVEVTKAYIPTVVKADKPLLKATIVDTAYINPDVDYSVTPLAINTQLQTRPINPATVTYWEFNRPAIAQIKVGAGYPWNTLLQAYASTHNASVGYLAAKIDHVGNYSKIESSRNGDMVNATEALNSGAIAAGLYIADKTLAADLSYSNDIYHNYAFKQATSAFLNHQQFATSISFGDSFVDLSKLNYNIGVDYSYFFDRKSNSNNTTELMGSFGREYTVGKILLDLGYKHIGSDDEYDNSTFELSAMLDTEISDWNLEIGVKYIFDGTDLGSGSSSNNYFVPQLYMSRSKQSWLSPFFETNGYITQNSFEQLSAINPYIYSGASAQSSMEYNLLAGITGQNSSSLFNYRLYAGYTFGFNSRFWGVNIVEQEPIDGDTTEVYQSYYDVLLADQNKMSFNMELKYFPISNFGISFDAHYYSFAEQSSQDVYINSLPNFEASLGLEYLHRDFSIGLEGEFIGERSFSVRNIYASSEVIGSTANLSSVVDLSAYVDWRATERLTIFIQGENLCNANLYPWAMYRGFGAQFTAGVKINFR